MTRLKRLGSGSLDIDEQLSLGVQHHQAGHLADAETFYDRVLRARPDHPGALNLLGVVRVQSQRFEEALALFDKAIAAGGANADYHANRGLALRGTERLEDAMEAFRRAVEIDPRHATGHYNLGTVLHALGRADEAIAALRHSLAIEPHQDDVHTELGAYLLEAGQAQAAVQACGQALRENPRNMMALGCQAIALQHMGQTRDAAALLDLTRFISCNELSAPPGFNDIRDFNRALARHVREHPTLRDDRTEKSTRYGRQTDDLLTLDNAAIAALESVIHHTVEQYLASLPRDEGHPYLAHTPPNWNLDVWGVVLESQGHQMPHMHGDGWVSGVYYVELPKDLDTRADEHAGWIEFGGHPAHFRHELQPPIRRIEAREGLLVLFPSYFHHRTVPFVSKAQRISIAFDAVPLWDGD